MRPQRDHFTDRLARGASLPLPQINARPLRPAILSNVRGDHGQKPREEATAITH
jgi:hypothetical protein